VEQDDGEVLGVWGLTEVEDVAIGALATNDGGARRGGYGQALGADRNFAVVADPDWGLDAPDVGPPGAGRSGADDGAVLGDGLVTGGLGGGAQFAVDFVLVGMGQELIQQVVGGGQFEDVLGGQQGDQAFLPVVVAALDFAFGLGGGGIAEGDVVEVEGGAQLGEGVGVIGVEEGMVVHIEGQGQAVSLEDAGEEIEVGQEGFALVEVGTGVETGSIIEDIQQDLLVGGAWKPGVGAGVVLPEGAEVAGLPASDGFWGLFVAGVRGEVVLDGPAADAGAVDLELETAMEFTGAGAVGGGRSGGEEFCEQFGCFWWPVGVMVAAGSMGCPEVGPTLGAGAQVVGAELVEAAGMNVQFAGHNLGRETVRPGFSEEVADEWGGETMGEL